MKIWLEEILCCPVCEKQLSLTVFQEAEGQITEGLLVCECQRWYPIIGGVPRIFWGEHRGDYLDFAKRNSKAMSGLLKSDDIKQLTTDGQVRETFSTIWDKFPNFGIDDPDKTKFYDKWLAQKLGLESVEELYAFLASKNMILEAGIGSGQKLKGMAEHTKGKVIGIDLTYSVDNVFKNTCHMPNVAVVQADLFKLPFKKGTFDFIISDGVLHHTPDTRQAFLSLVPFLMNSGEIAIRVYRKSGPIREFCDEFIRSNTIRVSEEDCWKFCEKMARLGESLAKSKIKIEVPEDMELLEFKKGTYDLQRFIYYNVFKCFYNPAFTFNENVLVNFDWYRPSDAHRHTDDEVKSWYEEAGLKNIRLFNPESGISARGVK